MMSTQNIKETNEAWQLTALRRPHCKFFSGMMTLPRIYADLYSSIPPAQTLCINEVDVTTTETFQGNEQTEWYVDYVTVTTEQTIWIGYVAIAQPVIFPS